MRGIDPKRLGRGAAAITVRPRPIRRAVPIIALLIAIAAAMLSLPPASADTALLRSVPLNPGFNQVVYMGPAAPTEMLLDQLPAAQSIFRWDAATQRYQSFSRALPAGSNDLLGARTGDVLWLRSDRPAVWTMPVLGGRVDHTLVPGWNILGWTPDTLADPASAFEGLGDRLRSAYVYDEAAEAFKVYSPTLSASLNTLDALQPNDAVWLRVSAGPSISWSPSPPEAGEVVPAAESGVPVARDSRDVERAIVHVQTSQRGGSGFIVNDSQILTSAHIVDDFTTVTLHWYDGSRAQGTVTAVDTTFDIAVISVDEMHPGVRRLDWESASLPSLTTPAWVWGFPFESNVIGAGFQLSVSVTGGIVSAIRHRDDIVYLQTDAAVNPGNSGGPITTLDGRVLGIVTSVFTINGRDAEGLNFAISVTEHRDLIRSLLSQ